MYPCLLIINKVMLLNQNTFSTPCRATRVLKETWECPALQGTKVQPVCLACRWERDNLSTMWLHLNYISLMNVFSFRVSTESKETKEIQVFLVLRVLQWVMTMTVTQIPDFEDTVQRKCWCSCSHQSFADQWPTGTSRAPRTSRTHGELLADNPGNQQNTD